MPRQDSPLRYALAGMIAMAAAMGIGRFVYTPILPGMMAELGLTAGQAGLIASANYLGYLIGAIVSVGGWASGRERPIMLAGLAASSLLLAAMGMTASYPAFLLVRFLAGLASAFVMIFGTAIVFSHLTAAGRDDLQGVHFCGVGAGITLSAIATGSLYLAGAGWDAGWLWSAGLSVVALVMVAMLVTEGPVSVGVAGHEPPLPRDPALRGVIAAYGLFGFGYIVTATFLVAIVRENGDGPLFESAVWLATGLAIPPSLYLWSRFRRRVGLAAAFAVGCLVEAAGVGVSVLVEGKAGPLVAGVLLGGTFVAITALGLQLGRMLAPASPRRVLALMTAAFGLGQILGPAVAGLLAEWSGSYRLPSLLAALTLLAAAAIVIVSRPASK